MSAPCKFEEGDYCDHCACWEEGRRCCQCGEPALDFGDCLLEYEPGEHDDSTD